MDERAGVGNAPADVTARLMPWVATIGVASWVFALAASLVLFYFGLVMGSFVPWLALPLTVSGVLAALYCCWGLWGAVKSRRADQPVVIIGPQGFHDTRLGALIPWTEITGLTREQPGTRTFLRITARDPARFARKRFLRRPVALVSSLSELDAEPDALIAAAEAHRSAA